MWYESTVGRNERLVYSTEGQREPTAPPPGPDTGPARIRLRLERRASGRLVTTISGLPGTDAEKKALARSLKTACGAGGTFKDQVLELQGDHRDRVEIELRGRGLRWKRAG
jgi:translation initiation factor 1